MFQAAAKIEGNPVAKALLQALRVHAQHCGSEKLLTGVLDVLPNVAGSAEDPVGFAQELRRIATDVIIHHSEGELMPPVAELLPGCKVWGLEAKRLLDETVAHHPWELSQEQQQFLIDGLLRRVRGRQIYVSIWPRFPNRARTRRDLELDHDMSVAIRTGRLTQPRCREILANLYWGEHLDLFDPVFAVIEMVLRGRRPLPEDFPDLHLEPPAGDRRGPE